MPPNTRASAISSRAAAVPGNDRVTPGIPSDVIANGRILAAGWPVTNTRILGDD
jgi:hypothetical protein